MKNDIYEVLVFGWMITGMPKEWSELAKAKKEDLVKVRNLGEKSIKIISVALAEKGVKFGE